MKKYHFVFLFVVIVNLFVYIIGFRDLKETIIDFLIAILIYIPLGICLKKILVKVQPEED